MPGFSADLEGACEYRGEVGSESVVGLQEGLWCNVEPEAQGGLIVLSLHYPTITFAVLGWWPGCQTASAKKELSRIQRLVCIGTTGVMCTTLTGAFEARSTAHRLWSLGRWSYLHPNQRNSSIMMQLQKPEPTFDMGVNVIKPTFNSEPKYRMTMLTKEKWTTGSWKLELESKGNVGKKALYLSRIICYSFLAKIYVVLACTYKIQMNVRPEKYVSIISDSQAALKGLQAAKTTFPLVQQCQKALNDIFTFVLQDSFEPPDNVGYMEMKLLMGSQGREPFPTLWDQNQPWGPRGRIHTYTHIHTHTHTHTNTAFKTSIWQCGRVLPVPETGSKTGIVL